MPSMREASTRKIYNVQSSIYDATFGRLVRRRVANAIGHMNVGDGDRVLDLGVGTGASLGYYPTDRGRVFGVDLSPGMLRECRKKIAAGGVTAATVFEADALRLPFADDSFDHVFISHVITVVSDPVQLIREAQRVAKADARIVIVNHFQSSNRAVAWVEKVLCPFFTKIGWRSDLSLQDLVRQTGMRIDYRFKLEQIDLWETVVISNNKSAVRLPRGQAGDFGRAIVPDAVVVGGTPAAAWPAGATPAVAGQ